MLPLGWWQRGSVQSRVFMFTTAIPLCPVDRFRLYHSSMEKSTSPNLFGSVSPIARRKCRVFWSSAPLCKAASWNLRRPGPRDSDLKRKGGLLCFRPSILATISPTKVRRALHFAVYREGYAFRVYICPTRTNRGHTGGGKHRGACTLLGQAIIGITIVS